MPKLISLDGLERFKDNLEDTYGQPDGPALLDENGVLTDEQLPESALNYEAYANMFAFPAEGNTSKIYGDKSTNTLYRWDATTFAYVSLGSPDAIKYTEQTLTTEQKAQARQNIGAISANEVPEGVVEYTAQTLTSGQQAQARTNIGAASDADVVKVTNQSLSTEQKTQARTNIGAADASAVTALQTLINAGVVSDVQGTANGLEITWTNGTSDLIPVTSGSDIANVDYDANSYLHFYDSNNDELFGGPFLIQGGGGGGAGYSARIVNGYPSTTMTVASSQQTFLKFTYYEYYGSEVQSDNGYLTIQYKLSSASEYRTFIERREIAPAVMQQINVSSLLTEGTATNFRVICTNGRSNEDAVTKTLDYTITSVAIGITTSFNSSATYTGNLSIPYVCIGRGIDKTVYLYIDDVLYRSVPIGTSHNQSLQISVDMVNNYNYGAHVAEMFIRTSEGAESDHIKFPILYDNGTSTDPIVSAIIRDDVIENGETLYIDYVCYTPGQESTDTLSVRVYDNESNYYMSTFQNIPNNIADVLPISNYPDLGEAHVELISGNTRLVLDFEVTEVQTDYDINPVTDGLVYEYRPLGYTNNSATRDEYVYELTDAVGNDRNIYSTLDDFNWVSDGYTDGESLKLEGSARMHINLPILSTSFTNEDEEEVVLDAASSATVTTSGRTIEFDFELSDVTDQNDIVFKCLNQTGGGFVITPQVCYLLADGQSPIQDSTGFIENEESIPCAYIKDEKRIRVSFVIQRKAYTDGRFTSYANVFINGEYANSYLYDENAIYDSDATITIGSSDCVTKLYEIRMYNRGLTKTEVLQNYMNSNVDIRERIAQNEYNDVLTQDGDVDYNKAVYKYPCLLLVGKLSNFKSDTQKCGTVLTKPDGHGSYTVEFSFLDQDDAGKFAGSMKVQGTSSQRFMRKNFKVYLAKWDRDEFGVIKLDDNDKQKVKKIKYALKGLDDNGDPLSIGESTLCWKADYMSTDHANTFNANIADTLFNDKPAKPSNYSPQATYALGARVLQDGDGYECIVAIDTPEEFDSTHWKSLGKYWLIQNTVWGFRCLLFNMAAEDYIPGTPFSSYPEGTIKFAGDGCLNNDKGNTKSFGLESDGDDGNDTLQQKWEFKDNSNSLCTFKTDRLMRKVYNEDGVTYKRQARNGLESCYPDEGDLDDEGIEPDYSHIQILYTWVYQRANFWEASTTSGTGGVYNGVSYNTERELKKAIFKNEFPLHFNMEHALVYYLFIEWVALCDNRAKNMFLSCKDIRSENIVFTNSSTSVWDIVNDETGEIDASKINWTASTFAIWYTDLYDLDSCFGAENSGYIRIPYFADWNYQLGRTGTYQFNGHDSRLWCMFEESFADEIKARAQLITRSNTGSGALNYGVLKQVHITDNAELVCPAIVNRDMEYKYEDPWTEGYWDYSQDSDNPSFVQTSDYKYLQRGSRTEQKESFIYRRCNMLYSKYQCDQFLNDRILFRCGGAVSKNDARLELSSIQTMWLGATFGDSGNPVMSGKISEGQSATISASDGLGRSDHVYIHGASNLTSISSLAVFKPYEIGLTNAKKLKTLLIGSNATGYTNGDLSELNTGACTLLDTLNIQNCTGFSDTPINLSNNTLIREVYAGGSTVPYFTFGNGGILETLELGTPKRIVLLNQSYLTDFSYDSLNELVMLRIENTPNTGVMDILSERLNDLRLGIRLVGIDETITDRSYMILKRLASSEAQGKRIDANGNLVNDRTAYPVISGTIHCPVVGTTVLSTLNRLYPDLIIDAAQVVDQYTITFVNPDGTAVKDRDGIDYIQYVDLGETIVDPVTSGEIDTPTMAETAQYTYTFTGWDNIEGRITDNRIVTALYTATEKTYRVRWFSTVGVPLKTLENVAYGSEVVYQDENHTFPPTRTDQEDIMYFSVFKGWNNSTGFIQEDTDVYAIWETARLPNIGTKALHEMNIAEIYGVAKSNRAEDYFDEEDYTDIIVGKDYNFENVQSEVLLENRYFNGSEFVKFDGTNGRPEIKLFDENAPSFTIAIDYEYAEATSNATIVSCCDSSGSSEGFRLHYYLGGNTTENNSIKLLWGDNTEIVGHGLNRNMLVLRHRKGSKNLYIASDNGGQYITHSYGYGNDTDGTNSSGGTYSRYDGYNDSIRTTEAPRAQETVGDFVLTFGAMAYGTAGSRFPAKGWIHWAKIWYDDLGVSVIQELANWSHETWRMQYRGHGLYNKDDGTGLPEGASFIAQAPLSQYRKFYPGSGYTTEGGWRTSIVRSFVNDRCLAALPYEWQSIIKPVSIATKGGYDNPANLEYTTDKIYLPAYADVTTSTTTIFSAEGNQISWFVDNNSRMKFMGINIPADAHIITDSASDPTLYTDTYTIREGDIWIKSNRGYVYVSADTASKHGYLCGRPITDTNNNIDAQGAQGGKWIGSNSWWTRTNATNENQGQAYYHYVVTINGTVQSVYSYGNSYQTRSMVIGFSI